MLRFASLGSGSKGNATLIQGGDTTVMVDCGFSVKETLRRMDRLNIEPAALDAVLVTHEHGDHCRGVAALSRHLDLPVYLTWGTAATGRCDNPHTVQYIDTHSSFAIGDLSIVPVAVPHDAREPCQFVFNYAGSRVGVLTDLGSVTPWVVENYSGCDALLLEANHDPDMLWAGSYPPNTKARVAGDWGHLSNRQTAQLLAQLGPEQLQYLVIAHISENNNCLDIARQTLQPELQRAAEVIWADQSEGFDWLTLS
jgi:phosphoribosyl 1,2-cyclic phosphodiesterase